MNFTTSNLPLNELEDGFRKYCTLNFVLSKSDLAAKAMKMAGIDLANRSQSEILEDILNKRFLTSIDLEKLLTAKEKILVKQTARNMLENAINQPTPSIPLGDKAYAVNGINFNAHRENGAMALGFSESLANVDLGKTASFAAKHSLGIGIATIAAGGGIGVIAGVAATYVISTATKEALFKALEHTGLMSQIRESLTSLLTKLSNTLGLNKLQERAPMLTKAAICVVGAAAVGVALASGMGEAGLTDSIDSVLNQIKPETLNQSAITQIDVPSQLRTFTDIMLPDAEKQVVDSILQQANADMVFNNAPDPLFEPNLQQSPTLSDSAILQQANADMVFNNAPDPLFEPNLQQSPTINAHMPLTHTELPVQHSVWRTYENYLETQGIEFGSKDEANRALVAIMQKVAELNPDLESVHIVKAGQVLNFPELNNLEEVRALMEGIEVTPENNVLANHAPAEGMLAQTAADLTAATAQSISIAEEVARIESLEKELETMLETNGDSLANNPSPEKTQNQNTYSRPKP